MVHSRLKLLITPLLFLLLVTPAYAIDLRVTDSSNTVVVVHEPLIDYGAFMNDKETEGIRILQGEAEITAKWGNIQTLTMAGVDQAATPPRYKVDIALRNGQKISAIMVHKGRMKLLGKTDLGDYSVDLQKIQMIAPVHANPNGSR